ncbi:hypothetical protein TSOC_014634, partial [Tetrabaena socialis]
MGGVASSARELAKRVVPSTTRKLEPFTAKEIDALNRLAEQEQARMRELPSVEEMNIKDFSLGDLLNKLGGSIAGRDHSPDNPQPQASTSGRAEHGMPPARPPNVLRTAAQGTRRQTVSADDQPGRLHSYVIREILEGRTAASMERAPLDLEPFVRTYGADRSKLLAFMEYNCLPVVGKVATFGHQYAFARAPQWWLKEGLSGLQFRSEPDELRLRLMGDPVVKGKDGEATGSTAMFRGGKGGGGGGK